MENNKDEIICISSDDDEDIKQNNVDNKQGSVIKQLEDNSVSGVKVEVSSSDYEKVAKRGQKRKASEISSEDDTSSENSAKVFVREKETSVEACSVEKEEEKVTGKEKDEDRMLLKPKLVVKEKKTISAVEQDIFPMFISLCLQKDRSEDMKVIVNKLKRRYEQLNPEYANSEAFIDFLNQKRNDIVNSKHKLYIHIAEVMNEMKSSCKGKSTLLLNGKDCSSGAKKFNRNNNLNVPSTVCSSKSRVSNSVVNDSEIMSNNTDNEEEQEKQDAVQRKIDIILKTMKQCEKYIKKLEESEIDFDDENNSNYIKLDKYKYRMVKLYNKYCEYTEENTDAGRQYLRPKHFSTTGIVTVDHAITSFINSKISKRNKLKKIGAFTEALIFPDYNDILKCVTKCNELHNLGLDNKKQQQIAKKAFTELGEYLQRCRRNDYWDTFSLFLENKEEDPALKDPALAEKLVYNKREGEKKLSSVFQEYVAKQEEMKDQITDSKTTSENEEDEEDSIENDNDNEDDISEVDTNLDVDKDKTSSDEDEKNNTDGSETPKSSGNARVDSDFEEFADLIEIEETEQDRSEESDRLQNNDDDNLEAEKVDYNVNTSKCKSDVDSESMKGNDAIPSPEVTQRSNTPKVMSSSVTNNDIPIDKTKEDESTIMNEDPIDDKPVEEKAKEEEEEHEKPLLRVRSFAKPPTTWKDVQEKGDEYDEDKDISKTLNDKDIIDLTQESPKENSVVRQCATIRIGSKVLPIVKGNYKTLVIPAGKSIINVKNITNNYLRVNTKNVDSSNVTKLESDQTISLVPSNQEINANNQAQHSQAKQKSTTVQISQSNQITVLSTKQKDSTSQRSRTNSSISK